jgi:hypothetical protein
MVNQMRGLKIKGYHPSDGIIPKDVIEVDILYKETNNPTVYTVKTIQPSDGHPLWPNQNEYPNDRGEFELTTDMVHAVVPSNQLLRPYDNVPRKALAQEITASRLVFGNYLQNYSVSKPPIVNLSISSHNIVSEDFPLPSVKTMRDYHVGVVYSDKYGRETPVLTNKDSTIRLSKFHSASRNRLQVNLDASTDIPTWAEYYSFYIKETSIPYYTLAQDRWYNAADGNIWLSFPSSERDKIGKDEFLILKKGHGTDLVVQEKAKYKVLAIDSEAPDFIKTRRVSLGKVLYSGDEGAFGFPIVGFSQLLIPEVTFENTFGDELYKERPKNLHVRIWGQESKSLFYSVTSIAHAESDSDTSYRITIAEPLGEELAFTTTDGTYATAADGISLELVEFRVENSPEFDGRFFVKIFKDAALSRYVASAAASEWFVQNAWQLGYINNNAYVNAGIYTSGSTAGGFVPPGYSGEIPEHAVQALGLSDAVGYEQFATYSNQVYTVGPDNIRHWTSQGFVYSTQHPTEHDWSDHIDYNAGQFSTGKQYEWLNADNSWPSGMYNDVAQCSIRAVNGHRPFSGYGSAIAYSSYNATARNFWREVILPKNRFFIDGCSAYSWSGGLAAVPGSRYSSLQLDPVVPAVSLSQLSNSGLFNTPSAGTLGSQDYFFGGAANSLNPGNFFETDGLATGVEASDYALAFSTPSWTNEFMSNTPYDTPGGSSNSSITMPHYGNPSRGVWTVGDYSAMDLSWTNFGDNGTPVADDAGDEARPHNLEEAADGDGADFLVQGAWDFIKALVEPGTTFRFKNDPDQQVYTVYPFQSPYTDIGYDQLQHYRQPTTYYDGNWGIRNVHTANENHGDGVSVEQFADYNRRQRWTILTSPKIGDTPCGYNPIHGTDPDGPASESSITAVDTKWRRALKHDGTGAGDVIEILTPFSQFGSHYSENPGIWETEPKEAAELDIYYQASGLIPLKFSDKTNEEYIPVGSTISYNASATPDPSFSGSTLDILAGNAVLLGDAFTLTTTGWNGAALQLNASVQHYDSIALAGALVLGTSDIVYEAGSTIDINLPNNTSVTLTLAANALVGDTQLNLVVEETYKTPMRLGWNNCWSFGNGVESDRIRDDFNAPQMDNGVKASATVANPKVKEEHRKYGMIWSDIYNSNSGVNNTNQFIMAEAITKDINPSHGSIQALKARDTRIIMFCEDKVLRADTNKNMLFNADGSHQVVASNKVVGSAIAYKGDYGISTNPESLVVTPSSMFFTDVRRGGVLALNDSEGARSISDIGMKDFFADLMATSIHSAIGSYDERKNEYNVSFGTKHGAQKQLSDQTTVSYSEYAKGWTSFKDFKVDVTPTDGSSVVKGLEQGISLNNNYYTFFDGHIWKHHSNVTRNNFYSNQKTSDVTVLFNEEPENIKSFSTVNYEGSIARITNWDDAASFADGVGFYNNDSTSNTGANVGTTTVNNVSDREYFNISDTVNGWYVDNMSTNLQDCGELEFKDKEGKYFAYPTGVATYFNTAVDNNLDEKEFSVQGLGVAATMTHSDEDYAHPITITVKDSTTNAAGSATWD